MRKSFTRLFGFLLLNVIMLCSIGLYAEEQQSTIELIAPTVTQCYNYSNSYDAVVQVKDFVELRSFNLTLKFDASKFQGVSVTPVAALQGSAFTPTFDNTAGTVNIYWSSSDPVTIGDNETSTLFTVKFSLASTNNVAASTTSALTWQAGSYFYYGAGLTGTYNTNTDALVNGNLTVPVTVTGVQAVTTQPGCNGGPAMVSVVNPVGSGYTYYINDRTATTSPTFTTVGPSTNTIVVTDANGCASTPTTVVVAAPSALAYTYTEADAKCYDGNGSIVITPSGASSPYTYYFVPAAKFLQFQTAIHTVGQGKTASSVISYATPTSLLAAPAGSYWINVDSSNGCNDLSAEAASPAWQMVTIGQPASPILITATSTDVTCLSAGTITVTSVFGGTISATHTYKVSIDATNWQTVSYPFEPITFNNLPAGPYTIYAIDDNKCVGTLTQTIGSPTPITFNVAYTDASCFSSTTGSISITSVSGGSGSYQYAVQLSSLGTTAATVSSTTWSSTTEWTGLAANYYSVFVKDSKGCTADYYNSTQSGNYVPVQQSDELLWGTNTNTVACNGGSYTLTVTATGGKTPYTYSFDGGTTTQTANYYVYSGLTTNTTVSVVVTDANGCPMAKAVTIVVPEELTAYRSETDLVQAPTCHLGTDGKAVVIASGGTKPYVYSADGSKFDSYNVVLVTEGLNTITVQDAAGCQVILPVTVDTLSPTTLTASASGTITCYGGTTGINVPDYTVQAGRTPTFYYASTAAAVYTSGASAFTPYSVKGVASTITPTAFSAGTYYVGLQDEYGCQATPVAVTVKQNAALTATVTVTDATCYLEKDGSLTIKTTGGNGTVTPTYVCVNNLTAATTLSKNVTDPRFKELSTYSSTTLVGQELVSVTRGTYYVVIYDGCKTIILDPVIVNGYKAITVDAGAVTSTNLSCNASGDGVVTVKTTGVHGGKPEYDGAGSYIYKLTSTTGTVSNTTGTFSSLAAGVYTVTVSDASGCNSSATVTVTLTEPAAVAITNVAVTHISCNGARNGVITVSATGGTPSYYLAINSTVSGSWLSFDTSTVTNATSKPYQATDPGTYYLYVKDSKGCLGNAVSVTVNEPKAFTVSVAKTDVTCVAQGTATLTAAGGWAATLTPTYQYQVGTTTQSTSYFTGLTNGSYTATVTDLTTNSVTTTYSGSATVTYTYLPVSCPATTAFTIAPAAPYEYYGSTTSVTCKGASDGTFSVTVTAGAAATVVTTGKEYYIQLTSTTTPTLTNTDWKLTTHQTYKFTGLSHGHYTVWIASANTVSGTTSQIYNEGACVLPVGTTEHWNANQSGPYYYAESWEVQEPSTALTVAGSLISDVTCYGGSDGSFAITAAGGTAPYKYYATRSEYIVDGAVKHILVSAPAATSSAWQSPNTFTGVPAGTWIVWVLDANGCIVGGETSTTTGQPVDAWRVVVKQLDAVTFTSTVINAACYGSYGAITVSPTVTTGGPFTYMVTGYDYNNSPVSIGPANTTFSNTVTFLVPANTTTGTTSTSVYTVTLFNANGCSSTPTAVAQVVQNKALTADLVKAAGSFTCPDDISGVIETAVVGGLAPYTYQLYQDGAVYTAVGSIPSFIVRVGHTYSVTVTDSKGCTASSTIVLKGTTAVSATFSETTCYGDQYASVTVNAAGETGRTFAVQYRANTASAYSDWQTFTSTISLTGFIFANTTEFQNFYYFNVKDSEGCTTSYTYSFVATQHPLEATMSASGSTGSLTITGGISPYSYQVGSGARVYLPVSGSHFTVSGLIDGTNTLTVYDAHGCAVGVGYTTDAKAPLAILYTPNGVTTTNNHPALSIVFDEAVAVGTTGNIYITKVGDTAPSVTIPASGITVSGTTATLTYSGGLDQNSPYYVTIDGGLVKDLVGNSYAGITSTSTWTFTTGTFVVPVIPPVSSDDLVFKVYPNPFDDYVNISSTGDLPSKVVISNIAGQIVKEVVSPGNTVDGLNVLRSGVYFISLYQDGKVVTTVKLLKR